MNRDVFTNPRDDALARAERHSPFLRDAVLALPGVAQSFLERGASAAAAVALEAESDSIEAMLRVRRRGLALAVALGDLSGELSLEQATRLLSDFSEFAIDCAVRTAIEERVPGAEPLGFAVIAMGKLGSRELNYSSDVDLL